MERLDQVPALSSPSIELVAAGDVTVVAVVGEIDLDSAERLTRALAEAIAASPRVLVDLCACTLIDSVGLSTLLVAVRDAKDRRVRLAVACVPGGEPRALFDLVFGKALFTTCADRASGLAELRLGP